MRKIRLLILLLLAMPGVPTAWGDIYRHDNGGDIISFTDSPGERGYTLIMKEQREKGSNKRLESARVLSRRSSGMLSRPGEVIPSVSRGLPLYGVITSTTGIRNDPFDGRLKHHNGMDIAAPTGTPVKPVAPGTVIFSGWRGGYGNAVIIEHFDGMLTVYAHHSSNQVNEGDIVDNSTIIALSGSTGRSTGPHLHFEAWREGENITQSFLPAGSQKQQRQAVASTPVRRYLQPDGTILFTNLR